jgi:hypothetical protein
MVIIIGAICIAAVFYRRYDRAATRKHDELVAKQTEARDEG